MPESLKRPIGATVLSLLLAWLSLAGLGNAVLASAHQLALMPPAPWGVLVALAYAVTALAAAIGLWRLRPWSYRAFLAWGAVVMSLSVWFWVGPFQFALPGLIGVVMFAAFLFPLARYVRRVAMSAA